MALEDSVVDLEVVVPTITKGGDAVEDSKVTSSSIAKKRLQLRRLRLQVLRIIAVKLMMAEGGRACHWLYSSCVSAIGPKYATHVLYARGIELKTA
jgi:hypothetical protein